MQRLVNNTSMIALACSPMLEVPAEEQLAYDI